LHLRVVLDREKPEVPSLSGIWKTADWHEREAYDFFGIQFTGHPNLTRILLPADWEGHPLRKDYVEQERYHGIKVKYEE
jgi:NADH-quinone oxidoreductase subunit C